MPHFDWYPFMFLFCHCSHVNTIYDTFLMIHLLAVAVGESKIITTGRVAIEKQVFFWMAV